MKVNDIVLQADMVELKRQLSFIDEELVRKIEIIELFYLALYVLELLFKIVAFGFRLFWKRGFNRFDFILVALSLLAQVSFGIVAASVGRTNASSANTTQSRDTQDDDVNIDTLLEILSRISVAILLVRLVRILRVRDQTLVYSLALKDSYHCCCFFLLSLYQIFNDIERFRATAQTLIQIMPAIGYFLATLFCVFYFFAEIGYVSIVGKLIRLERPV